METNETVCAVLLYTLSLVYTYSFLQVQYLIECSITKMYMYIALNWVHSDVYNRLSIEMLNYVFEHNVQN